MSRKIEGDDMVITKTTQAQFFVESMLCRYISPTSFGMNLVEISYGMFTFLCVIIF